MPLLDITGQKFSNWTAIKRVGSAKMGNAIWLCVCECGNKKEIPQGILRKRATLGIGCHCNMQYTKHSDSGKRLYSIYMGIMRRCYRPKCSNYYLYGGKGIKLCDEWLGKNGYLNFRKWALENGYQDNLSVNRIDGDKDYCPENCRWATSKQQNNNRVNNHYLSFNGVTHTIAEWSEITGINYRTLLQRCKMGWSVEDTLTKAIDIRHSKKGVGA